MHCKPFPEDVILYLTESECLQIADSSIELAQYDISDPRLYRHEDFQEHADRLDGPNIERIRLFAQFGNSYGTLLLWKLPLLNGVALELKDICKILNVEPEGHPSAFFYGLEGNVFGVKNPEPRMSMAGKLIHEGAGLLAQALLSSTELQLRGDLSSRFVISAIEGGWFTSYLDALKIALQRLARPISGYVHWKIDAESCHIHMIRPEGRSKIGSHVKDFTNLIETFDISAKVSLDILKEHTDEQN